MSSAKPDITEEIVRELLAEVFGAPVSALAPVAGGEIAQTFAFQAAGQAYIIRCNAADILISFEKEAFIAQHFAAPGVPIPPLIRCGRCGDLSYAIAQKAPGRPLTRLTPEENDALLPALLDTLAAIHRVDVRDWPGWGSFDGRGSGGAASWPAYLAAVREEADPADFWGHWHDLFADSFLERDVFDRVYAALECRLGFCPTERWLIHGDYGYGNVLAQDGRITAVLDWLAAKYGDFLYDVAWLAFWRRERDYAALYRQHAAAAGRVIPHYAERLLCYQCYISLDGLRYFAKFAQADSYAWVRARILELPGET